MLVLERVGLKKKRKYQRGKTKKRRWSTEQPARGKPLKVKDQGNREKRGMYVAKYKKKVEVGTQCHHQMIADGGAESKQTCCGLEFGTSYHTATASPRAESSKWVICL